MPSEFTVSSVVDDGYATPVDYSREDGYQIDGVNYSVVKIEYANTPKALDPATRVYEIDTTYWNRYIGTGDNIKKIINIKINE